MKDFSTISNKLVLLVNVSRNYINVSVSVCRYVDRVFPNHTKLAILTFFVLLLPTNEVWGKVIFSEACVSHSVHRGCAWWEIVWVGGCVVGACMMGGMDGGGVHNRGCMMRGMHSRETCMVGGACITRNHRKTGVKGVWTWIFEWAIENRF